MQVDWEFLKDDAANMEILWRYTNIMHYLSLLNMCKARAMWFRTRVRVGVVLPTVLILRNFFEGLHQLGALHRRNNSGTFWKDSIEIKWNIFLLESISIRYIF